LRRLLRDHGVALAAVGGLLAAAPAVAGPEPSIGYRISGIETGNWAGSVSCAGDVNGDGLDDVIVGARYAPPTGEVASGRSYVVFGKANSEGIRLAEIEAGVGGFVLRGIDFSDNSGRSVSGGGDINGDMLDDLVIGARGADPGGVNGAGEVYVVFGKANGTPVDLADVAAGVGGFVVNGIDENDQAGYSVSITGDVNGDGRDDLIIGAALADPLGSSLAGESYVVFGKANGTPVNLSSVTSGVGGFVIRGVNPFDQSGNSVSAAGDVNGDNLEDLVVGAFRADPDQTDDAGTSYVVFGKANGTPVNLSSVMNGSGGFAMIGDQRGDLSGSSVSGAGDVNGDNLDDVLIGAPGGTGSAGTSYVVFGKADTILVDLAQVENGLGGFSIVGEASGDRSGRSVSDAGDVNGDGMADVIIGAYSADPPGRENAGASYVVFGKMSTTEVDLADVAAGTGGFVLRGIFAGDRSGEVVSGAGDVNGDSLDDVIIGALFADPFGNSAAGESYVVYGKADTAAVELEDLVNGCPWDLDESFEIGFFDVVSLLSNWGPCLACQADFNGDGIVGFDDLIVVLFRWGKCPS
jgi:hypothetical protein